MGNSISRKEKKAAEEAAAAAAAEKNRTETTETEEDNMATEAAAPADEVHALPVLEVPAQFKRRNRRSSVSAECGVVEEKYVKKVIPKSEDAVQRIRQAIGNSFLFAPLDSEQLQEVIDSMEEKRVTAGDVVIRQGDPGDFFYVIDSGKYDVLKKNPGETEEKKVFAYDETGSFGELALMYTQPRAATVKASTDGVLWAVTRSTFRHIIVSATLKSRKLYESFIGKVPLFENLTEKEKALIADCLEPVEYQDGDSIIVQGEAGDKFYIIERGEAKATQTHEGKEVEVGRMQVGQYFGERALLTNEPRAANVIAVGDTKVAAMDRAAFERLLGECKQVMTRQITSYKSAKDLVEAAADDTPSA